MEKVKPHVILNAAAFTDVEQVERQLAIATTINGEAPGVLAREAARYDALLIHYSTDNVFDGELDRAYRPSDPPLPANAYGSTKLQGEEAIRAEGGPHLILRTSWLYGPRGNNFLTTVLDLADAGRPISVVSDQFGAPTWTRSVAAATVQILSLARAAGAAWMEERFGTYHLTAGGRCSWYEFAAAVLDRYLRGGLPAYPPVHVRVSGERGPARQRRARLRGNPAGVRDLPGRLGDLSRPGDGGSAGSAASAPPLAERPPRGHGTNAVATLRPSTIRGPRCGFS